SGWDRGRAARGSADSGTEEDSRDGGCYRAGRAFDSPTLDSGRVRCSEAKTRKLLVLLADRSRRRAALWRHSAFVADVDDRLPRDLGAEGEDHLRNDFDSEAAVPGSVLGLVASGIPDAPSFGVRFAGGGASNLGRLRDVDSLSGVSGCHGPRGRRISFAPRVEDVLV